MCPGKTRSNNELKGGGLARWRVSFPSEKEMSMNENQPYRPKQLKSGIKASMPQASE